MLRLTKQLGEAAVNIEAYVVQVRRARAEQLEAEKVSTGFKEAAAEQAER